MRVGHVSLVGAGPGDPALLTRKAIARLRAADLVLYDALIDERILRYARHAQRFFVGKRAGRHALTQDEINALMIRAARRGRRVVRLKGGDPFVLGRGGEEALALAAAGVPFEVVPGVTSAIAAPALAGIPVTHRGLASGVPRRQRPRRGVVRGGDRRGSTPNGVTLVVLMGMARLARAGRPADRARLGARDAGRRRRRRVDAGAAGVARARWAIWPAGRRRSDADGTPGTVVIGEVVSVADARRFESGATVASDSERALCQPSMIRPPTAARGCRFAKQADIDEFVSVLDKYERGEITPDQWRAFRLVRGTYGQRQAEDAQMLRIKIPQGLLTAAQLHAMAEVGEQYSRGFGHITTRQNIQFHFVKLHDVEPAMRQLAEAGLTTREACGNSVRNITGCPYAGVSADELFDVTPYAEELTRFLLRHQLSSMLPRKFKIAFEGCTVDHIATAHQRPGVHARVVGARTAAAASASRPAAARRSCAPRARRHPRVPAGLGDLPRRGSGAARVPPLRRLPAQAAQPHEVHDQDARLGRGGARIYDRELAGIRLRGEVPTLEIDTPADGAEARRVARPDAPSVARHRRRGSMAGAVKGPGIMPVVVPVLNSRDEDYTRWRATNVRPQKQFGFAMVVATIPLGDMTSAQMRVVGDLATAYGDGTVRVTMDQDLVFRWVKSADVRALYAPARGRRPRPGGGGHDRRRRELPGRGVVPARGHAVARPRPAARGSPARAADLIEAADGARIKISGCPNGCGQHHIATIGFQGSVRRLGGRGRAAVLRDGRRRHRARRRELRPAGGEDSGAPDSRGRRAADRDVRARAAATDESAPDFFARVERRARPR